MRFGTLLLVVFLVLAVPVTIGTNVCVGDTCVPWQSDGGSGRDADDECPADRQRPAVDLDEPTERGVLVPGPDNADHWHFGVNAWWAPFPFTVILDPSPGLGDDLAAPDMTVRVLADTCQEVPVSHYAEEHVGTGRDVLQFRTHGLFYHVVVVEFGVPSTDAVGAPPGEGVLVDPPSGCDGLCPALGYELSWHAGW